MEQGYKQNQVNVTVERLKRGLPEILPVFERTEPRTFHHWRDAIEQRRQVRKAKRAHLKFMAETGSHMLSDLLDEHSRCRIER